LKKQLRVDFHVHSNCSSDSVITPEDIVEYATKRSLDAIAITDHNQVDCALDIAKNIELLVIPSIEVSTLGGHVVGLNVKKKIPKNLSVQETVNLIHDQGGLAVACHPFAWFKGSLGINVYDKFDAIETINASAFPFKRCTKKAFNLAQKLNLAQIAGTDAHVPQSIGLAYTLLEAKPNIEDIMNAILEKRCKAFGKPIPHTIKLKQQIMLIKKFFQK
jgi:predicted metal-dependent phosphoesterase TrpH